VEQEVLGERSPGALRREVDPDAHAVRQIAGGVWILARRAVVEEGAAAGELAEEPLDDRVAPRAAEGRDAQLETVDHQTKVLPLVLAQFGPEDGR
jgi:hypothetical protein